MANWKCPNCSIVLDAEDEGQTEPCPLCGQDMETFTYEDT